MGLLVHMTSHDPVSRFTELYAGMPRVQGYKIFNGKVFHLPDTVTLDRCVN